MRQMGLNLVLSRPDAKCAALRSAKVPLPALTLMGTWHLEVSKVRTCHQSLS